MQLYALENNSPIAASKGEKGKDYLCPECRAPVRVRGGPSRQIHFYHPTLPKNCRQHQKSEEHLQLQIQLLQWMDTGGEMESRFDTIGRIADVAWHERKIVFEIQRSPISRDEARERNLDYQKVGYSVVWILHDAQFNKNSLSAAEDFLRGTPCYFTNIDKSGKGIIYDQFEVIRGNKRLFKGPRLTVSLEKISMLPQADHFGIDLPQLILHRLQSWALYAHGDLLCRLLRENNPLHSAQTMVQMEKMREMKKEEAAKRLPLLTLIKKSYLMLLDYLTTHS